LLALGSTIPFNPWGGVPYIAAFERKCHGRKAELGLVRQTALTRDDLAPVFGMESVHVFQSTKKLTSAGLHLARAYDVVVISELSPGGTLKDGQPWDDEAAWNEVLYPDRRRFDMATLRTSLPIRSAVGPGRWT
jgi:hypothetical protein